MLALSEYSSTGSYFETGKTEEILSALRQGPGAEQGHCEASWGSGAPGFGLDPQGLGQRMRRARLPQAEPTVVRSEKLPEVGARTVPYRLPAQAIDTARICWGKEFVLKEM